MQSKTIIVGGGMAGMSCAMRLMEAKDDFLLVTDSLGGRVMYDEKAGVNFGAYFVMGNYVQAKKILARDTLINPTDACFHNSESERFAVLSGHTLTQSGEFVRFLLAMREFSAHYETYKRRCLDMPQKTALAADPYMADLFTKPAAQFIREKRYERAAADYISKFTYACTGADTDQLTALDFLNVSMGLIVPIHKLKFDRMGMAQKLGGHLLMDTISRVEKRDGGFILQGKSGEDYAAENIVIATPAVMTQELLGLGEIRRASKLYVYHVKAELKPAYQKYGLNLFPYAWGIMLTARQADGSFLIYTREKGADLGRVCAHYEVLRTVDWERAMYVQGKAYLEQEYGEGLYVAGDHNGLGMEPAAISGIYAANRIIARSAEGREKTALRAG